MQDYYEEPTWPSTPGGQAAPGTNAIVAPNQIIPPQNTNINTGTKKINNFITSF